MTESSHELVAASAERVWDIIRVVGRRRVEPAGVGATSPAADEGTARAAWTN